MTQTLSTDLYRPEVWEDIAQAEFTGKSIVATSAAVTVDDTLIGQPGDTVEFPKWMSLGELDDLSEGTPMVPEKLKQSASKATIKEAGKAVEISDKAKLTGIGNAQDEAIRQFGVLAARKVDADLITAAQATVAGGITYADGSTATASAPLTFATAAGAGLTWNTFVDGTAVAGDDFEPEDWALFVRTEQRVQLLKDDDFIQAANAANSERNVIQRGFIGFLGGSPVYVTNRLATNKGLFVKNGALGLLYKRRPIVEQDRDILARSTIVTTNVHYATKRLNDKGVIVATFTPSA
jgi:N4-gp56 family major capsid protein